MRASRLVARMAHSYNGFSHNLKRTCNLMPLCDNYR